jgi:membrane protease YdiL (CAAX protease family)
MFLFRSFWETLKRWDQRLDKALFSKSPPKLPTASWPFIIAVLGIGLAIPILTVRLLCIKMGLPSMLVTLTTSALTFILVWGALRFKHVPLRTIGFSLQGLPKELAIGIGISVVFEAGRIFLLPLIQGMPPSWPITIKPLGPTQILALNIEALAVGISEEALGRGFAISFLMTRLKRRDLVVLISSVIFGLSHFHLDLDFSKVLSMTAAGVIFGVLFIWRGYNLTVPIVVHVLLNLSFWLGIPV